MEQFAHYASQALHVRLPQDYAGFMEAHGKRLSPDPVHKESWLKGLGAPDFVIGTTLAFRSTIPGFRTESVVIGYVGVKKIIINRVYEDIDEYLMLDTRDGSILGVDSFGATNRLASSFEEWLGPELVRAMLKDKYSSNLTVVLFDDELKAEEARLKLLKLQREGFVELEDAVVVVKDAEGNVRYHQTHRMVGKGGIAGSITGLIVGSILLNPLLGVVFGAVTGAVSASLTDVGIDDRFMEDLCRRFEGGCAALFTLVRKADPEKVGAEFFGFGGKVLMSSVSKEREDAMQAILNADTGADER